MDSEGIYLFPIICPSIGYIFYRYKNAVPGIVWGFQIISFCALLASIEPVNIINFPLYSHISILFHANTIHASLGAAFIFIAAIFFLVWVLHHSHDPRVEYPQFFR